MSPQRIQRKRTKGWRMLDAAKVREAAGGAS